MNQYETIFLMKDDITEEQRNEIINKIVNYLNTNGKITEKNDLGLKRLAYEIRKHTQAYYYQIYFEAKSTEIAELERLYRITDEILKFITIRQND